MHFLTRKVLVGYYLRRTGQRRSVTKYVSPTRTTYQFVQRNEQNYRLYTVPIFSVSGRVVMNRVSAKKKTHKGSLFLLDSNKLRRTFLITHLLFRFCPRLFLRKRRAIVTVHRGLWRKAWDWPTFQKKIFNRSDALDRGALDPLDAIHDAADHVFRIGRQRRQQLAVR